MKLHKFTLIAFLLFTLLALSLVQAQSQLHVATIFSEVSDHVHGSTIVELPNGDLLAAWFQGDGERSVERLAIMGSRLRHGNSLWDEPFLMADMPDFPEQNPVLFLDQGNRLWLVWYTIIAHQSETSLIKYRTSERYQSTWGPAVGLARNPSRQTRRSIPERHSTERPFFQSCRAPTKSLSQLSDTKSG